jgi:HPt (histidine-containing phosphotransfer) domain-containing protein
MASVATESRRCNRGPASEAIDREHLARMTFGEESLARELLELFDRQAVNLLARMRERGADSAALAHTLKGSAGGIGAWNVVRAADACERAAGGSAAERGLALDGLAQAVDEAHAAIAEILAAA